ncbi:MAG: TIGR00266 family protein [bacterium]|nr:TIGR00266 family protein [bacterium]
MNYKILYTEAFPVIEASLRQGESLKAESDAMIAMSPTIELEGKMEGGIMGTLVRKVFTGKSMFMQTLTATRGPGTVLLGHPLPGGIMDVSLDGSYGLIVQKSGFLAATQGISVETHLQKSFSKGFMSGEGFFLLKIVGEGVAFVSSYGVIHPINLEKGEDIIIDNGHLVAWPDYMHYEIEAASSGWFSSLTSGEGVVCHFYGPGTVLIQTRNPASFQSWILSMIPSRS